MRRIAPHFWIAIAAAAVAALLARAGESGGMRPPLQETPAEATQSLDALYAGDTNRAIAFARALQAEQPAHPLGYLLEVNAMWWRIYCEACEIRWGMIDAWTRPKLPADTLYFTTAEKGIALAEAELKKKDSAAMRFYAGTGWALKARLHALRGERMPTARAGVKAREHLLRAVALDADLADACLGLGLYNYYVDTLSTFVKVIRFFMGIPGGSRKEGMRQLERAARDARLTAVEARFYIAKFQRNYEQQYARGVEWLAPLVERYPQNALFRLVLGDLHRKLGHAEVAAAEFRAAQHAANGEGACAARVRQLSERALKMVPGER